MNQLTIAGLGIKNLAQMTLESQTELLKADEVLYLGTSPRAHIDEIKSWGAQRVRSILEMYEDGDVDQSNYDRIYHAVLETISRNSRSFLLVPGHPRIGVTLVQRLSKIRDSFNIIVLPGVSSFDTMINDLERDPLEKGSIILDANRMLLFDTQWPAHLDCYIFHVCSIGTRRVHLHDAKVGNAWHLLKAHLLKIYPSQKPVKLISSSTGSNHQLEIRTVSLLDLEALLPHVHFGTSLFIAADRPKKFNADFLSRLRTGGPSDKSY